MIDKNNIIGVQSDTLSDFEYIAKESGKLEKNIEILRSFGKLQKNWNLYDADPFEKELIEKCVELVKSLKAQPEIFPTARDSIQFEYYCEDGTYLEIGILKDSIEYFWKDSSGKKAESENAGWEEVLKIIERFHTDF